MVDVDDHKSTTGFFFISEIQHLHGILRSSLQFHYELVRQNIYVTASYYVCHEGYFAN